MRPITICLLLNAATIAIVNSCEKTNHYQRYYGNCNVNIDTCLTYHHFKFKWNANAQVWSGESVQTPSSYESETGAIEHAVQELISTLSSCNCEAYYYNTEQCELQIRFCFSYKTPNDVTLNHPQYEAWATSIHDANIYGHFCCNYNKTLSIQSAIHNFVTEQTCESNNITTSQTISNMSTTSEHAATVSQSTKLSTSAHGTTTSHNSNRFPSFVWQSSSTTKHKHTPSTTISNSNSMVMVISIPGGVFVLCVCFLMYTLRKRKRSASKDTSAALMSSQEESSIAAHVQVSMLSDNDGLDCEMNSKHRLEWMDSNSSSSSNDNEHDDDEKEEILALDTPGDDIASDDS